jgi:hypothetical protein
MYSIARHGWTHRHNQTGSGSRIGIASESIVMAIRPHHFDHFAKNVGPSMTQGSEHEYSTDRLVALPTIVIRSGPVRRIERISPSSRPLFSVIKMPEGIRVRNEAVAVSKSPPHSSAISDSLDGTYDV